MLCAGVIRRKVHRDQNAAYVALAREEEQWPAENHEDLQTRDSDIRGPIIQRNVDEQPSTAPWRHLLPSAYLTTSPRPSDRSSLLSTTNSLMYIHHAKSSSNESATTDIKPGAKSVPLSHRKEQGKHSIWPSPGEPWDDRIVQQLSYMPQRASQSNEEDRLRTILVYSSLGATPAGREKFLRDECPTDKCTLTTDVRWIAEADAIVFPYDPGVEVRSWPKRPSHQIWVLSLLESPLNLPSIIGTVQPDQLDSYISFRFDNCHTLRKVCALWRESFTEAASSRFDLKAHRKNKAGGMVCFQTVYQVTGGWSMQETCPTISRWIFMESVAN